MRNWHLLKKAARNRRAHTPDLFDEGNRDFVIDAKDLSVKFAHEMTKEEYKHINELYLSTLTEEERREVIDEVNKVNASIFEATRASVRAYAVESIVSAADSLIESNNEPPRVAEWLIAAVTPKKRRDAILGDLDERFALDSAKLGARRARLRYCAYVVSSVGPMVWRALKKWRALAFFEVAKRILLG